MVFIITLLVPDSTTISMIYFAGYTYMCPARICDSTSFALILCGLNSSRHYRMTIHQREFAQISVKYL